MTKKIEDLIPIITNMAEISDKNRQDALKVINCLIYIKQNPDVIVNAVVNRDKRETYASDRDFKNGVLRDPNQTSFHLNSYNSPDDALKGLNNLILQIEEIINKISAGQLKVFIKQFDYDGEIGCLEQRTSMALVWGVGAISSSLPNLDDIMNHCRERFEQNPEGTLFEYISNYVKTNMITKCVYDGNTVEINKQLIANYLCEHLGEGNYFDEKDEKEQGFFWEPFIINGETSLRIISSENALVKIIKSTSEHPSQDNHWGLVLTQLEDPSYARPQRKNQNGTWAARDSNSIFAENKFEGNLSVRKNTKLIKKTPATLLPKNGYIRLFSEGCGLLFDLEILEQLHTEHGKKNIEKSVFELNNVTWNRHGDALKGNANFNRIRQINRQACEQQQLISHNEIVIRLSKHALRGIIVTEDKLEKKVIAIQKQRLIMNSITLDGRPIDLPIIFAGPNFKEAYEYTKEDQQKDLMEALQINPNDGHAISAQKLEENALFLFNINKLIEQGNKKDLNNFIKERINLFKFYFAKVIDIIQYHQRGDLLIANMEIIPQLINTPVWPKFTKFFLEYNLESIKYLQTEFLEFLTILLANLNSEDNFILANKINDLLGKPINVNVLLEEYGEEKSSITYEERIFLLQEQAKELGIPEQFFVNIDKNTNGFIKDADKNYWYPATVIGSEKNKFQIAFYKNPGQKEIEFIAMDSGRLEFLNLFPLEEVPQKNSYIEFVNSSDLPLKLKLFGYLIKQGEFDKAEVLFIKLVNRRILSLEEYINAIPSLFKQSPNKEIILDNIRQFNIEGDELSKILNLVLKEKKFSEIENENFSIVQSLIEHCESDEKIDFSIFQNLLELTFKNDMINSFKYLLNRINPSFSTLYFLLQKLLLHRKFTEQKNQAVIIIAERISIHIKELFTKEIQKLKELEKEYNVAEKAIFNINEQTIGFAKDKFGEWHPVIILESQENRIKIHYQEWKSKWDEWIELNSDTFKKLEKPYESIQGFFKTSQLPQELQISGYLIKNCNSDTALELINMLINENIINVEVISENLYQFIELGAEISLVQYLIETFNIPLSQELLKLAYKNDRDDIFEYLFYKLKMQVSNVEFYYLLSDLILIENNINKNFHLSKRIFSHILEKDIEESTLLKLNAKKDVMGHLNFPKLLKLIVYFIEIGSIELAFELIKKLLHENLINLEQIRERLYDLIELGGEISLIKYLENYELEEKSEWISNELANKIFDLLIQQKRYDACKEFCHYLPSLSKEQIDFAIQSAISDDKKDFLLDLIEHYNIQLSVKWMKLAFEIDGSDIFECLFEKLKTQVSVEEIYYLLLAVLFDEKNSNQELRIRRILSHILGKDIEDSLLKFIPGDLLPLDNNPQVLQYNIKNIIKIDQKTAGFAKDSFNQWYAVEILERGFNRIKIHYQGSNDRWDEWIELKNDRFVVFEKLWQSFKQFLLICKLNNINLPDNLKLLGYFIRIGSTELVFEFIKKLLHENLINLEQIRERLYDLIELGGEISLIKYLENYELEEKSEWISSELANNIFELLIKQKRYDFCSEFFPYIPSLSQEQIEIAVRAAILDDKKDFLFGMIEHYNIPFSPEWIKIAYHQHNINIFDDVFENLSFSELYYLLYEFLLEEKIENVLSDNKQKALNKIFNLINPDSLEKIKANIFSRQLFKLSERNLLKIDATVVGVVQDWDNKFYLYEIIEKKLDKIKIHYKGYKDEYDEWIALGSDRLQNLRVSLDQVCIFSNLPLELQLLGYFLINDLKDFALELLKKQIGADLIKKDQIIEFLPRLVELGAEIDFVKYCIENFETEEKDDFTIPLGCLKDIFQIVCQQKRKQFCIELFSFLEIYINKFEKVNDEDIFEFLQIIIQAIQLSKLTEKRYKEIVENIIKKMFILLNSPNKIIQVMDALQYLDVNKAVFTRFFWNGKFVTPTWRELVGFTKNIIIEKFEKIKKEGINIEQAEYDAIVEFLGTPIGTLGNIVGKTNSSIIFDKIVSNNP